VAASEDEKLAAGAVAFDAEPVAGQRLPARESAQLEREALERRKTRRLAVKVTEIEPPTCALPAGVLAHDAIKPALQAAGQLEDSRSMVSTSASSRTAR
jgi:hypothetical protein